MTGAAELYLGKGHCRKHTLVTEIRVMTISVRVQGIRAMLGRCMTYCFAFPDSWVPACPRAAET